MPNPPPFRRVAILGTGLIGGSFALALRKHFPGISIVGFDRSGSANPALARGAIDQIAPDLPAAPFPAPTLSTSALPNRRGARCGLGLLIAFRCRAAHARHRRLQHQSGNMQGRQPDTFRGGVRFLGGHPCMAGKEHSGFENADAELFRGAPYALVVHRTTGEPIRGEQDPDPSRKRLCGDSHRNRRSPGVVRSQKRTIGPWASSRTCRNLCRLKRSLASCRTKPTKQACRSRWPAQGLQDTLRLAGSPYSVWRDILFSNTENISRALDRMSQAIEYLRTQLTSKGMEEEFANANAVYSSLRKPK